MAQAQHAQQGGIAPRILRIGIVLGGNIIEEKLVRERETVTIGQSAKNSFSVPIEGLPRSFPIFEMVNGRYYLHFKENMDGRISAAGGVHTLGQLKQQGAQRRGEDWVIALDERARGKVSVGAMTLLFQFVTAPPLQPRPRLPASVRGTLADRIEPRLAIILASSVLIHFAVGLWAYTRDRKVEKPIEKIARSFQPGLYEPPPPVEPVVVEEATEDGDAEEAAGTEEPKTVERPRPNPDKNQGGGNDNNEPSDGGGDEGPDDAAIEEAIQDTALVAVLTGEGSDGGMFSKMSGTDQGASLDNSIAHAKGKATATVGDNTGDRQRGQNSGKIASGKGGKVGGPGPGDGDVASKKEEEIESKIKLGSAADLSLSDLDPAAVVKRIRGKYLAGIKRCHARVLKVDPKAQGKVTIRFTVGPTGRVTKADVNGFDPTVDACIKGQAAQWRFSAPKDEGKPTSADFEVPLLLKPGA